MNMEGKWWVLYEHEPINIQHTRVYDFRDGMVLDGRTGSPLGRYEVGEQTTTVMLEDERGDGTIYQFGVGHGSTDDIDACHVNWTTSGFELYRANWPIPEGETDEQELDREEWEQEYFGMRVTYGAAMRDGPRIQELHDENQGYALEVMAR